MLCHLARLSPKGLFLMRQRIIAFYPEVAREIGIEEAIYYQQLWYWGDKGDRSDGFIWKSMPEIEQETTLSDYQQRRCRAKLEKLGWLLVKQEVIHGRIHYLYKATKDISVQVKKLEGAGEVSSPVSITKITHIPVAQARSEEIIEIPAEPERREKPARQPKVVTPSVTGVFNLFHWNPARMSWRLRVVERDAAQALFDTYGLEELEKRIRIIRKHKDEPMCPQIDSPSELLNKMTKMEHFLKNL